MIIKRQMDQEIRDLHDLIQTMSHRVLAMLELGIERRENLHTEMFDQLFDQETEVNRLQMRIDDLAWKIMALYQPTASDLRYLIGAIKVASSLERQGDEICSMARRLQALGSKDKKPYPSGLVELQVMTRSLIKDGITVLENLSEDLAESIFLADDFIDETFEEVFVGLREQMKKNPEFVEAGLDFLAVARCLERIADLATNLAEVAVFVKKGQDVRHHGLSLHPLKPQAT